MRRPRSVALRGVSSCPQPKAAAALGGFDSIIGAVVGGIIVGVAQSLTIQYFKSLSSIVLIVPFGIILLVLLFKPAGLFGKPQVERV